MNGQRLPFSILTMLFFCYTVVCYTNIQCDLEAVSTGKGHFTFTGTVGEQDSKVCTKIAPGKITTYKWIRSGGCKDGGELIVNDNIIRFKCACTKWFKDCNIDHTLVFDYAV